jgi:hypothetical protein
MTKVVERREVAMVAAWSGRSVTDLLGLLGQLHSKDVACSCGGSYRIGHLP